jgi:hypothetical protein
VEGSDKGATYSDYELSAAVVGSLKAKTIVECFPPQPICIGLLSKIDESNAKQTVVSRCCIAMWLGFMVEKACVWLPFVNHAGQVWGLKSVTVDPYQET